MARWVEEPHHIPRKCAITGRSAPDAGPYLEFDFRYFDADPNAAARGELVLQTLYLSTQILRDSLATDGAPFLVVDHDHFAAVNERIAQVEDDNETLRTRIAELEAGAPVTVTQDQFRLLLASAEDAPASSSGSTDPDHHEAPPKRRARKAA